MRNRSLGRGNVEVDAERLSVLLPRYVPLLTPATSTNFDGDSFSTTAKTLVDLSTEFRDAEGDLIIPAGVIAIDVEVSVRDSASDGSTTVYAFYLSPNNTTGSGRRFSCNGVTNDARVRHHSIVPCNADGDVYYQVAASGTLTLDVEWEIWGYWV